MPKVPDNMPDKDAILSFTNSDKGRNILERLNDSDPKKLKQAAERASAGDITGAMAILQGILSSNDDSRNKEAHHGK